MAVLHLPYLLWLTMALLTLPRRDERRLWLYYTYYGYTHRGDTTLTMARHTYWRYTTLALFTLTRRDEYSGGGRHASRLAGPLRRWRRPQGAACVPACVRACACALRARVCVRVRVRVRARHASSIACLRRGSCRGPSGP